MENRKKSNNLIVDFMGLKPKVIRGIELYEFNDKDYFTPLYDLSWDWLMPVLTKIREIYFSRAFDGSDCGYYYYGINIGFNLGNKDIHIDTYNAVVDFIKWYNKNKEE